ncbi:MAG TPA: DUF1134 domain-containing protein [Hyphomicrobiales bacterium]|nr:DUF1134 domain-containing protein [Hyphomicrobiales bacterium]
MPTHASARLALASALALALSAGAAAAEGYGAPTPAPPHDYGAAPAYGGGPDYGAPPPRVIPAPDMRQDYAEAPAPRTYSVREIVDAGNHFFGAGARDLAELVERAGQRWGRPNGYILGEEGSGAVIGGLRYGEGVLYTRPGGGRRVFWQGPSVGWDFGGNGNRTMFLIYNLPSQEALFGRYGGINGSVYLVGGLGMTAMENNGIVLVPIQFGVGARLGINVGYLKFTPRPTWNPF